MQGPLDGTRPKRPELGPESSSEPGGSFEDPGETGHGHRSSAADGRLWPEAILDRAVTVRLHPYGPECGTARSLMPARGRLFGTFLQAIANLKAELDDHRRRPKLTLPTRMRGGLGVQTYAFAPGSRRTTVRKFRRGVTRVGSQGTLKAFVPEGSSVA